MAQFVCSIQDLGTSSECNTRAGIKAIFLGEFNKFNRAAIAASMQATGDVLTEWNPNWYDSGNTPLAKWEFERQGAFYDQTYTSDTDQYEQLITIILNGKNATRVQRLQQAVLCCRMAGFVFYNTGAGRMIGFDYDGATLDLPLDALRVGRHLDTSGTLGDSAQRDEIDLTASNFNSTPYVDANVQSSLSGSLFGSSFTVANVTGVDDTDQAIVTPLTGQTVIAGTYSTAETTIAISNVSADTRVVFSFTVDGNTAFSDQVYIQDTDTEVTVPKMSVQTASPNAAATMTLTMDVVDDATLDTDGGETISIFEFGA